MDGTLVRRRRLGRVPAALQKSLVVARRVEVVEQATVVHRTFFDFRRESCDQMIEAAIGWHGSHLLRVSPSEEHWVSAFAGVGRDENGALGAAGALDEMVHS